MAASDRQEQVLEVDGLSVAFGRGPASMEVVRDISLAVGRGEAVGIVGESGSGKTVTCMAVAGLLPHLGGAIVAGRVRLLGEDVTAASERRWRQLRSDVVSAIFQQPTRSLNPAFTVGDQIAEVLRTKRGIGRKEARRAAVELLDRVQIADAAARADDYPHQLSGGMCQRVMIAIAIACTPKLLIADEPTTALDVTVQAEILSLLRELQTDLGLGILYVSHDLAVVDELCDRVVVMYGGEVVEEAATDDLFDRPRHPYTAGLLRCTPGMAEGAVAYIRGHVPSAGEYPEGCRFHPRCDWCIPDRCTAGRIELIEAGASRCRCVRAGEIDLIGAPS